MQLSIGVLSSSDVLNSQLQNAPIIHSKRPDTFYGSGLVDSVGNFIKASIDLVKDVSPALGVVGLGVVGGKKRRKHRRGGEVIDRDELEENMEEYV
jgi:hypothetical protein